jgi:hypothetical protein
MALNTFSTAARNAICDAFVDLIDIGSADPGGDLQIHTAAYAALLAEPEFGAPAFGAAATGVATANAITDDASAAGTGTAAVLRIRNRDNTALVDGTVGTSGQDLNLNTTSITTGDVVSITAATITAPAS